MGYVSIALSFLVLIVLSIGNVTVFFAALAAALVVIVSTGMPFTETVISTYFTAFGGIVGTMFPMYLFGAVLARLYTGSGAATAIAESVCGALFDNKFAARRRCEIGLLSVILAAAILCYGGINAAVALITLYPIALSIFERAGIPKRFIMGAICGGAFTFSLSGPGSPQPTNVVAMALGTPSHAGLVAGVLAAVLEIAVMVLILSRMCRRATARGEQFAYGPKDVPFAADSKRPHLLLALTPLVFLLALFNLLQMNISIAALCACVLAAVLFWPYLRGGKILAALNEGATMALLPAGSIAAVNGFAAVIQRTEEYGNILDAILGMNIAPVFLLVLSVAFICCLTGGSTTGTQIALPVIAGPLMARGLSAAFIHRVGVYAATMLDSLPHSGAVIMAVNVADLKMREAYMPVFVSTVVATTAGTVLVALLMWLFPFLP